MKSLIVYDSKHGNNKQIAETIAARLSEGGHEVRVHHAKEVSPKEAIEFGTELLIFGGPLRAGNPSFTAKRWVSGLSGLLGRKRIELERAAAWATHGVNDASTPPAFSWETAAPKWEKILAKVPAKTKVPGITDFSVMDMEGPLEDGWQEKAEGLAARVLAP